jgi:hypothetical protein
LPFLVEALLGGGDFKGQVDEDWLQKVIKLTKVEPAKELLALALVQKVTGEMLEQRPRQRFEFLSRQLVNGPALVRTEQRDSNAVPIFDHER